MKKKRKTSGITPYAIRVQEVTRIFDEFSLQGLKRRLQRFPLQKGYVP